MSARRWLEMDISYGSLVGILARVCSFLRFFIRQILFKIEFVKSKRPDKIFDVEFDTKNSENKILISQHLSITGLGT